jgi:hypothetical protein
MHGSVKWRSIHNPSGGSPPPYAGTLLTSNVTSQSRSYINMDQPLTAVQQTSTNMNQPSEPTPLPRSGFSAEVIVAIFTVTAIPFTTFIAYIYAQAYQVGFCKYFEIPNDYISLSSFMILSVSWGFSILLALTTIAILLILYLIVSTYGLLLSLPPQHQERGFLDRLYAVWHRFPVVLRILVMVMVISFAAGGWVPLFNKWGEK